MRLEATPTIKQRALDVALEYNDLQAALMLQTLGGSRTQRCSCFILFIAYALKTHEYQLAAETLDKILKIDPTADLEQILASIAPENAQTEMFY